MQKFSLFRRILVLCVVTFSLLYTLPLFFPKDNSIPFLTNKKITLGLDLQGGSHLLLEINRSYVLKEFYSGLEDSIRSDLKNEKIKYENLNSNETGVFFSLDNEDKMTKVESFVENLGIQYDLSKDALIYTLKATEAETRKRIVQSTNQVIEVVRRRIDQTGTQEPLIQRQGEHRIVVQLPGIDDPQEIKDLLGKTAKMDFHLVSGEEFNSSNGLSSIRLESDDGGYVSVKRRPEMGGEDLIDAQANFQDGRPVVSFRFNTKGARKFGRITSNNVGKRLAIVLDKKVISSPNINDAILGGSGIITGNFTVEEANDLALLLRSGALPAPVEIVEERTVGAGLGADSIQAGKYASVIGLIFVVFFMTFVYRSYGVFASIALFLNITIILAVMIYIGATLTLPGIAGIVLTMGIAVDSNVLIFERIKEEFQKTKILKRSCGLGFDRAVLTIIDANITGLIGALVLYYFGSGAIRGFAVSLSIGIFTSLFTSVMVSRWLVSIWVNNSKHKKLPF